MTRGSEFLRARTRRWVAGIGIALALATVVALGHFGVLWFVRPSVERFPVRGIDVSHHQGDIDWAAVAASGRVEFAYLKATEGGDWVDPTFATNWAESAQAGIPRGAYHYFTFCRSGAEQAENFIANVPVDEHALAPAIDLEFVGNCTERPAVTDLHGEIEIFASALEQHYGRRPIIYTTEEFHDRIGVLEDHELWLRDLFGEPDFAESGWRIWQFHSRARLPGIDGPVDLNVFNGTRNEFLTWQRE